MPSYSGKVVVERFEPNDTWTGTVVEDEQPTERNNRGDVSNKKSVIATDFGEIKEENLGVFETVKEDVGLSSAVIIKQNSNSKLENCLEP